jgi:hypothetical protein
MIRLLHCDVSPAASKANPSCGFVKRRIVNEAILTAVRLRHAMQRLEQSTRTDNIKKHMNIER